MANEEKPKSEVVSRRSFLKGGAVATGALSSALLPSVLPDPGAPSCESSATVSGAPVISQFPRTTASTSPTLPHCSTSPGLPVSV